MDELGSDSILMASDGLVVEYLSATEGWIEAG
jgi:hypothetical protein